MKKHDILAAVRRLLLVGLLALAGTLNAGVITISGNTINDPAGNPFLFRGPNLALAWWPVPGTADTAIPEIAAANKGNCNGLRLVWDNKISRNTVAILQNALQKCEDNNLAVILAMHYGAEGLNGGTDPAIVNDAVAYWTGAALPVIKRYENRIVLNIVNEWNGSTAGGDASVYVTTYRNAIATIRNAGIHAPILIDSAGWGQDSTIIYQSGQTLLNSDPERNVVFAIHMYELYPDANSVRTALERIKIEKGLPVIVGEFGPINNGHFVDAVSVMNYCEQYQVGYCAWVWHQDPPDLWDMMNGWLWSSGPTTWGNTVFNSPGGIHNSAFNGKGNFDGSPAVIGTQPQAQTATAGQNVIFRVAAGGNPAPTYQWQRLPAGSSTWGDLHEGGSYQGMTGATLTVTAATPAMSGDQFRCVATNSFGSVNSDPAVLMVIPARPPYFDAAAYLAHNPDLQAAFGSWPDWVDQAWMHYWLHGLNEGRTDGDFDPAAYLAMYPDLQAALGTDLHAAALHWYTYGRPEGRRIPAGFDVRGYLARYPDLATAYGNDLYGAWLHYLNQGVNEGQVFDTKFRAGEYPLLYGDLASLEHDPRGALLHWLTYGRAEGRMGRVPAGFDVAGYLSRYPDLAAVFGGLPYPQQWVAAWDHYVNYGINEGRTDGDFDPEAYLAMYGDLRAAFGDNWTLAAMHWYTYGRYEGRRIPVGFDARGYLGRYVDLQLALGDDLYGAWLHYLDWGVYEGRVYDEVFRPDEYLAMYPDLRAAFGSDRQKALLHWLYYGQYEGRLGRFP